MSELTIGELCAGYGGLGMGVKSALGGGRIAWVSDIDKGANKVLAHRFPGVPNIGDMTAVDWTQVEPVDVLTGGTPCQDLSHAGKRAGMSEGTRSNLWVAMREAIAVLRPSLVIWENVGGAYSAAADSEMESREGRLGDGSGGPVLRALGRVLGDLASLGYVGGWHGLRAADVGAPHGRLRVFVVAWPAAHADGWQHLASRSRTDQRPVPRSDGDSTRPDQLLPTPRATDGTKGGPNQRGSSGDLMLPSAVAQLLPTPTQRDHKDHTIRREPHRPNDVDTLARALTVTLLPTPRVSSERTGRDALTREGHWSAPGLAQAVEFAEGILPREYQSWDEVQGNQATSWGDYAAAIARWESVLGQPAPAPTMTSAKGNPQLSPAFTEWMMGLPHGWITDVPGVTRNEALKLCGNGVVPQQAAHAIRFLLGHLSSEVAA